MESVPQQATAGQNDVNRVLNAENNGREEENWPDAEPLNIEANVEVWSENEINRLTPQQRQSLPDKMICLICLENVRDAVFRGCGHFLVCKYCMMLYVHCPVCDIKIKAWDGASWDL